jgi:hypothetical protein
MSSRAVTAGEAGAIAARDQLGLREVEGRKGFGIGAGVGDIDEAGAEQFGNVLELGVILALQGIGDRDRRYRNSGGVAGKREQRMIDAVAGQDHDRALGRQSAREQTLREPIHALPRRAVGQLAPVVLALGQEQAVRSALDRRTEEAGEARVVGRQGPRGSGSAGLPSSARSCTISGNRIGDRAQRPGVSISASLRVWSSI